MDCRLTTRDSVQLHLRRLLRMVTVLSIQGHRRLSSKHKGRSLGDPTGLSFTGMYSDKEQIVQTVTGIMPFSFICREVVFY